MGAVSREQIDTTVTRMDQCSAAGDMRAWAGFFAENGSFINSAMSKPAVGREAIVEMTDSWPRVNTVIEWRVIEGSRMVIGWREHQFHEDGGATGWYRGMSTFVFTADGRVEQYEGVFDLVSLQAALKERQAD